MTEDEKKELDKEVAIAAGIDPKLIEVVSRIHEEKLNPAEKIYVDEMNKLTREMAKRSDIECESKIKARIFDDHWMLRIEEHLTRHLPYMIDGSKVVVYFTNSDVKLEGVVEELDAGYILVRDDDGKKWVITWSSGPVFEILPAALPEEKSK